MVNKRILYTSVLSLLLLLSVYFVVGEVDTTNTNILAQNGSDSYDNWTKGAVTETFNFTIFYTETCGVYDSISYINISWPAGNYTFEGFISLNNSLIITETNGTMRVSGEDDTQFFDAPINTANDSLFVRDLFGTAANWFCYNKTGAGIDCGVLDIRSNLSASGGTSQNTTISILVNMTTVNNYESIALNTFEISTSNNDTYNEISGMNHTISLGVDGWAPTITDINVSDGNTTISNVTGQLNLTVSPGNQSTLRYGPITVRATVLDINPGNVWIYYNNSEYIGGINATVFGTNTILKPMITSDFASPYMYSATFSASEVTDGNMVTFVIFTNDTLGNEVTVNDTYDAVSNAFAFNVSSTDIATISNINVTNTVDGVDYKVTNPTGSDKYLPLTGTHTFDASFNVQEVRPIISAVLFYNTTGAVTVGENGVMTNVEGEIAMNNVGSIVTSSINTSEYTATMTFPGNDTNVVYFAVVGNNSGGYYVIGSYQYTIDGTTPTEPVLTVPTTTSISTSGSISYSCSSTDAASGGLTYAWVLTKPSGTTVSKTGTDATFSGTETNEAGTYSLTCTATDAVGNAKSHSATTTEDFHVSYASTTSSGSGGGSSGGGISGAVTYDVDLSSATVTSASISGTQGAVKTFTLDKTTKHTVTFKTISASKAVIVIASAPVEVELTIGESKEVDMNADSVKDIKVTLNSITNGKADVKIDKLAQPAVKTTEETSRGSTTEKVSGGAGETGEGTSLIWLWIALVVIALLVIGYFVFGKKK